MTPGKDPCISDCYKLHFDHNPSSLYTQDDRLVANLCIQPNMNRQTAHWLLGTDCTDHMETADKVL